MATLYKRGRTYWGRVQIDRKEYRKSLGTPSLAAARQRVKAWEETLRGQVQWGEAAPRTYDEAMESFLLNHVPTLRPGSQRRYYTSARALTPRLTGLTLDKIDATKLAEFEADRRRDGASSPTIRRDLACLSSMFTHVDADLGWFDRNPVLPFLKRQQRRGRLKESPPRTRYLTHDEEAALIANASPRIAAMIQVNIDTGLRREELMALTWRQVNLRRHEITVYETKSGEARTVPLLERSAQILAQQPRHISSPYVFTKNDGTRIHEPRNGLANAARRAGVENLCWHDLRRTCGCRLLQDHNMSIERVSKWLGHQSIAQTQRSYAFLDVRQLHEGVGTKTGTGYADSAQKEVG